MSTMTTMTTTMNGCYSCTHMVHHKDLHTSTPPSNYVPPFFFILIYRFPPFPMPCDFTCQLSRFASRLLVSGLYPNTSNKFRRLFGISFDLHTERENVFFFWKIQKPNKFYLQIDFSLLEGVSIVVCQKNVNCHTIRKSLPDIICIHITTVT